MRTNLILAALLLVPGVSARNDATWEGTLEGRRVTVLLDLPGDSSGADVYVGRRSPLDFTQSGGRNRRYGVALRRGDEATITKIKVKDSLVEVHLDGGGFGFMDSLDGAGPDTSVERTKREKRLQEAVKREADPVKKRRMEEELGDLKHDRRREQARLEAEAAQVRAAMRALEMERRLRSGSRINLRFDGGVTRADLTPEAIVAALDGYLSFEGPGPAGGELQKGMSRDGVAAIHGQPSRCEWANTDGIAVETCTHENARGVLEARYVDGVLVRYRLESR
jgi:hypothetical protein